jgi:hypothetical protein
MGEGLRKGAGLTRSERPSWTPYCQLAHHVTDSTLAQSQPTIERNLRQLRASVTRSWGRRLRDGHAGTRPSAYPDVACPLKEIVNPKVRGIARGDALT